MERRRGSLIATASVQGGSIDNDFYNPNPNYLTIVALEDGCEVSFYPLEDFSGSVDISTLQYSINGSDEWIYYESSPSIVINKDDYVSFKGDLVPTDLLGGGDIGIGSFYMSSLCNLTGNCNSILFGDDAAFNLDLTGYDYCFCNMFNSCFVVEVSPTFLPATTLAECCYDSMFLCCTSLTTAPELPATELAPYCYEYMFYKCSSLNTAPSTLPATTLAASCYEYMFYGTNVLPDCSNIDFSSSEVIASLGLIGLFAGTKVTDNDLRNILPVNSNGKYYLPAMELAPHCYQMMFSDCTSLTTAPELPATILVSYCYISMFQNCTSLTTAPELPAKTLISNCYYYMFYGCSKLNYIKAMFTTTPSTSYTNYWVYGVASSGRFVKNKNATWNVTGESGIPSGWTVVLQSPYDGTWGDGSN